MRPALSIHNHNTNKTCFMTDSNERQPGAPLRAGPTVEREHPLAADVRTWTEAQLAAGGSGRRSLHGRLMAEVEPQLLTVVMDHCANNQSRAAELLGLNRGTLRTRLERYGLLTKRTRRLAGTDDT